ncbi:hypothetical protein BD779DRAFT_1682092 [Infundibulicybe gibba]|nr:hypothetical protein BD779DRAFT_1682092 [Infundibulicybe gibba]
MSILHTAAEILPKQGSRDQGSIIDYDRDKDWKKTNAQQHGERKGNGKLSGGPAGGTTDKDGISTTRETDNDERPKEKKTSVKSHITQIPRDLTQLIFV